MGLFSSGPDNEERTERLVEMAQRDAGAGLDNLDEVVGYLDDGNDVVRGNATAVLSLVAEEYPRRVTHLTGNLERVLEDRNPTARANAAVALAKIAEEHPGEVVPTVEALVATIEDRNANARTYATKAISHVAQEAPGQVAYATGYLGDRLGDGHEMVRQNAATTLFAVASEYPEEVVDLVDPLVDCLSDDHVNVRVESVAALLAIAREFPDRVGHYADELADVVASAGGNSGNQVNQMVANFGNGDFQTNQPIQRIDREVNLAAATLTVVGAGAPRQVQREVPARTTNRLATWIDEAPATFFQTFEEILGDLDAILQAVAAYLERPTDAVRNNAMILLFKVADKRPDAVLDMPGVFVDALDDDLASVRGNALGVIGVVATRSPESIRPAIDDLLTCLHDANEEVRTNAVPALGTIGQEYPEEVLSATETVLDRLDDPEDPLEIGQAVHFLSAVSAARPGSVAGYAEAMASCFDGEAATIREFAAKGLANLAAERPHEVAAVGDQLVGRLYDSERTVQRRAARAIASVAAVRPQAVSRAADPLADQLDAADDELRRAAARSLAGIAVEDPDRVEPAVPALTESLDANVEPVGDHAAAALLAVAEASPEVVDPPEDRLREVGGETYDSLVESAGRSGSSNRGAAPTTGPSASPSGGSFDPSEAFDRAPGPGRVPGGPTASVDHERIEQVEHLGTGGNADVHRGLLELDGVQRQIALKEPRAGGTMHAEAVERFLEEARTWEKLDDSPFVVDVVDWGTEPLPWIAMEYMDGGHLGDRAGDVSLEEGLWIAWAICHGVWHAHQHGIAHLDLKPENVLFRQVEGGWDVPKVADWGLSEALIEHSGSVDGLTTQYAAPEQFDADRFGDSGMRTDVYALGAVLYELFVGAPPVEETGTAAMYEVIESEPDPPSQRDPSLPPTLDDVLLRCLAKDQADRYESSILVREAITDVCRQVLDEQSGL